MDLDSDWDDEVDITVDECGVRCHADDQRRKTEKTEG